MEPILQTWAGGEDEFLLRIGEFEALDDITDAGVLDFRWRLSRAQERGSFAHAPVKIRETLAAIRLGLIGAGMDRRDAERKVKQAFEDADISELALLAYTITSHSLSGKDHDPVGEDGAAENPPASSSPTSTETAA